MQANNDFSFETQQLGGGKTGFIGDGAGDAGITGTDLLGNDTLSSPGKSIMFRTNAGNMRHLPSLKEGGMVNRADETASSFVSPIMQNKSSHQFAYGGMNNGVSGIVLGGSGVGGGAGVFNYLDFNTNGLSLQRDDIPQIPGDLSPIS